MALKVRLTPNADRDLAEIRTYMVQRNPHAADRIRVDIDAALERIADFPLTGAATDEGEARVVSLTRYPYRIFYVVGANAIDIVHIRHASRAPVDPATL